MKFALLPVIEDLPPVSPVGVDAAQDIHECGFARAILTDERMDLPRTHNNVYLVERAYTTGKDLFDILHFEQDVRHVIPPNKKPSAALEIVP